MFYNIVIKYILYICIEFFMVLDFKVNARLVVGMTINFFCADEKSIIFALINLLFPLESRHPGPAATSVSA